MLTRTAPGLRAHLSPRRIVAMLALATAFALSPQTARADNPPTLLDFEIVHIVDDYWLLYGEVDDEAPEYCIILFGGVLQGAGTCAESDGTFSYCIEIPPNVVGVVSAQACDLQNQLSNKLECYLYQ